MSESTRTAREELIFDVFVTAVEQGINYWAEVLEYVWDVPGNDYYALVRDREDAETPWIRLDGEVILRGIKRVNEAWKHVQADYQMNAYRGLAAGAEDVDFDAETADVIAQFGLLGELTYG